MPATSVEFVVRADKPAALLKHIEALTDAGATGLRISNLVTMEKRIGDTVADRIKLNQLLQAVSAAALILAAAGLYALLAHLVISRGRELAIRKALGATPRDLLVDSLSRGLKVVALGVVCGLPAGLLCASWLRSRLYATSPFDLVSVVLVVTVLLLVGLVATLRPAFVAAQVSPMDVLRAE
jgi:ABC-type antimicrobial peptide transport system permease subunit